MGKPDAGDPPVRFGGRSGEYHPRSYPMCARKRTPTIGWKSRSERRCLSAVEGNCVIERWGGEQPEANIQPVSNTMLNPIQSESLASLCSKGEAREVSTLPDRGGVRRHQSPALAACARKGGFGMFGGGMAGSWSDVKRGSRPGTGAAFMAIEPEEPHPGGDRAPIVAEKRVTTVEPRGVERRSP